MLRLGDILKELREEKGLKQEDLAHILKVSRASVSSYENNSSDPSLDTLINIADYFNVSTDFLLRRTKNPTIHNEHDRYDLVNKINNVISKYDISKK